MPHDDDYSIPSCARVVAGLNSVGLEAAAVVTAGKLLAPWRVVLEAMYASPIVAAPPGDGVPRGVRLDADCTRCEYWRQTTFWCTCRRCRCSLARYATTAPTTPTTASSMELKKNGFLISVSCLWPGSDESSYMRLLLLVSLPSPPTLFFFFFFLESLVDELPVAGAYSSSSFLSGSGAFFRGVVAGAEADTSEDAGATVGVAASFVVLIELNCVDLTLTASGVAGGFPDFPAGTDEKTLAFATNFTDLATTTSSVVGLLLAKSGSFSTGVVDGAVLVLLPVMGAGLFSEAGVDLVSSIAVVVVFALLSSHESL